MGKENRFHFLLEGVEYHIPKGYRHRGMTSWGTIILISFYVSISVDLQNSDSSDQTLLSFKIIDAIVLYINWVGSYEKGLSTNSNEFNVSTLIPQFVINTQKEGGFFFLRTALFFLFP